MSNYRVLFLTDNCDATALWLAGLEQFDRTYSITVAPRSTISTRVVAHFGLIIIGAEAGTMVDALSTCRRLHARMVTPILMVSPLEDEEYALEVYKAGADEYIVEPISLRLLHAKLRAWRRWTLPVPSPIFVPVQEAVRLN